MLNIYRLPHGDLDEQDAAALEIGEEHLDHGIGHEDDAEQDHERAGDRAKVCNVLLRHVHEAFNAVELREHIGGDLADGTIARDGAGERPLQRYGQGVEAYRHRGEQRHRHEALEGVDRRLLDVASAGGVFDAALEGADHEAHAEERPAQMGEELDDGLHPCQLEQLHAHVAHLLKEIPKGADDLAVEPVEDLGQYGRSHKVPYEQWYFTFFLNMV